MIGMELLQLLQGDPLAQMRMGPQPAPNPNPQAPPPQQAMPPVNQPTMQRQSPAPAGIGGPPGHFETLPDQAQSPHWVPGPATGPIGRGPPLIGTPPGGGQPNPSPGPQGGSPGPQGGPQPPNPLPQSGPPSVASQSPPDLVNLYMRLMQQQRAGSAIDHGLALMASAYAAPGTQGQIMHSMDNQQQDPSAMMGNLVQLENMQRMSAARPALIAGLTGGGQGGQNAMGLPNIDPNVLNAMSNDQLQKFYSDQVAGQIQAQTKLRDDVVQGRYEAASTLPDLTKNMTDMDNRINIIKNTPEGDSTALQNIMADDSKKRAVAGMLSTDESKEGWFGTFLQQHQQQWASLTPAEQAIAMQMKQLGGQQYGQAFSSLGNKSRRSTAEVGGINAGLSQVKDLTQPYTSPDGKSGYLPALNDLQNQIHKGLANAYGAAGNLDAIPENLRWDSQGNPLVDQSYRPGGQFAGQGGAWLNNPPPKSQGQPAGGGRALAGSDLDQVRAAIAANPGDRDRILSTVSKNGYSTGGL
jgi:hypothetical protein